MKEFFNILLHISSATLISLISYISSATLMADGHEMYSSVINTLLPDNNHLTDTNSDLAKNLNSIRTINDEITALAMKNLKLPWAGDFESLKRVVSDYIKFDGRWSSPGGEKKVCSNPDSSITRWKNKNSFWFKVIKLKG
jgi:hypothetical protein